MNINKAVSDNLIFIQISLPSNEPSDNKQAVLLILTTCLLLSELAKLTVPLRSARSQLARKSPRPYL
jgi:hypothetical protein